MVNFSAGSLSDIRNVGLSHLREENAGKPNVKWNL